MDAAFRAKSVIEFIVGARVAVPAYGHGYKTRRRYGRVLGCFASERVSPKGCRGEAESGSEQKLTSL